MDCGDEEELNVRITKEEIKLFWFTIFPYFLLILTSTPYQLIH